MIEQTNLAGSFTFSGTSLTVNRMGYGAMQLAGREGNKLVWGPPRDEGEAIREALNNWIRTGGAFDAVVDFEAATRDPNDPKRIRPEFDPGDHLHPNDAGYRAMAEAVDLSIFTKKHGK